MSQPFDATSAALSTASPVQPVHWNTSAISAWAPHCWSSQGVPYTVKVQVSVAGMPWPARMSAPARSW